MIATIALLAVATASSPFDAVKFSHKLVKDETTNYLVDVSGDGDAGDMKISLDFSLKTKDTKEDGTTAFDLHVNKSVASFGGQENRIDETKDLALTLDRHGAPSVVNMNGFEAVFYIVLLTRYLPDQELNVGDKFTVDLKIGDATFKGDGSFSGTEELEGKKYSVLLTKAQFSPVGDDPGNVTAKNYFDATTGKIVRTEATIGTPGGEFKMTVKTKS